MGVGCTLMLAAMLFASAPVRAEGENAGETQMCVPLQQIDDRRVIDDKTILLKMVVGPSYKRIDLARPCSGLQLCKQDILRVIQEPLSMGSQCIIDQIVTIDEAEAKALMAKKRQK